MRGSAQVREYFCRERSAQVREYFCRERNGRRDIVAAVRCRYKARLECARREIHAGIEHRVEETIETRFVARHYRVVAVGNGVAEIQTEHAADRLRRKRHACLP